MKGRKRENANEGNANGSPCKILQLFKSRDFPCFSFVIIYLLSLAVKPCEKRKQLLVLTCK